MALKASSQGHRPGHCFLDAASFFCRRPWLPLPTYPAEAYNSGQLFKSEPPHMSLWSKCLLKVDPGQHIEAAVYGLHVEMLPFFRKACPGYRPSSWNHSCDKLLSMSPLPSTSPITRGLFYFSSKCKESSLSTNLGVEKWWRQEGIDKLFTVPEHRKNTKFIYLVSSTWRRADCGLSTDAKSVFIPGASTVLHGVLCQQQHQRLALDVWGALCFPHAYSIVSCRQMNVFGLWERNNHVLFYKLSLTRESSPTNLPLGKHWVRAVQRGGSETGSHLVTPFPGWLLLFSSSQEACLIPSKSCFPFSQSDHKIFLSCFYRKLIFWKYGERKWWWFTERKRKTLSKMFWNS